MIENQQMADLNLCSAISEIIADYRVGEVPSPTPNHVQMWVSQFATPIQDDILREMQHVFSQSYFTKASVTNFIQNLIANPQLVIGQPIIFWQSINFLNIQLGGNSQNDMLQLFDSALRTTIGLEIENCNSPTGPFVYLDDVIFSGNRVRHDLETWICSCAPSTCIIHIIVMAYHRGGQWYASNKLKQAAQAAGKEIEIHWWRGVEIEDRRYYLSQSDVLRPIVFPQDAEVQQYINMLTGEGYPPEARVLANPPYQSPFFKTEEGRQLLEHAFLHAGVRIRQLCPFLPDKIRPLGYSILKILGFGSVIVTFRNCPNTCPPAFWAGYPWYPLFPRKTN